MDENGWNDIHLAAQSGNLDQMIRLHVNGADLNVKTKTNMTPFLLATEWGRCEVVTWLKENGADIHSRNDNGWSAIHFAAKSKQLNILSHLCENGADVNARTKENGTPLHIAAGCGWLEGCQMLINNNADIHFQDDNGWSAIHYATISRDVEFVKLLYEHGANLNIKDKENLTPLHIATRYGWMEGVKFLIENGSDINLQDNDGNAALHNAIITEKNNYRVSEIISLFTSSKSINLKLPNNAGYNTLLLCVEIGNISAFDHLLEVGDEELAVLEEDVDRKFTALHLICFKNEYQFCKKLIEHAKKTFRNGGQNLIEKRCKGGLTPLSLAVCGGYYDLVELLVETGRASVGTIDDDGNTLVHLAAMKIDSSMKEPNPELSPNIFKIHFELKEKHKETLNPAMSLMSYLTSKGCPWKETDNPKVKDIIQNQAVRDVLIYYGNFISTTPNSGLTNHRLCMLDCPNQSKLQTIKCGHLTNFYCHNCFQSHIFKCAVCGTWHNRPTQLPASQNHYPTQHNIQSNHQHRGYAADRAAAQPDVSSINKPSSHSSSTNHTENYPIQNVEHEHITQQPSNNSNSNDTNHLVDEILNSDQNPSINSAPPNIILGEPTGSSIGFSNSAAQNTSQVNPDSVASTRELQDNSDMPPSTSSTPGYISCTKKRNEAKKGGDIVHDEYGHKYSRHSCNFLNNEIKWICTAKRSETRAKCPAFLNEEVNSTYRIDSETINCKRNIEKGKEKKEILSYESKIYYRDVKEIIGNLTKTIWKNGNGDTIIEESKEEESKYRIGNSKHEHHESDSNGDKSQEPQTKRRKKND